MTLPLRDSHRTSPDAARRCGGLSARILIAAALCLIAGPLHPQNAAPEDGDPRVTWLTQHAVRLRPLDASGDGVDDLEPLRAPLTGVRVVLLGEQSHGDGSTFLAKARLIQFLHEKMGFDVLAFESGLYDCAKAWDRLVGGEAPRQAVSRGVFGIWTASREVQPVIEYLGRQAGSDHPLELAGVDCQLTGSAATDFLVPDLTAFMTRIDPGFAQGAEWNRVVYVIRHLTASSWELGLERVPPPDEQAAFARTIGRWRSVIAARDATPAARPWSGSFWRQVLTSLQVYAEQTWRTDFSNHARNVPVFAMRDRQMGENLVWLARERYPNRKIIVWGATFHNARRIGTLETGDPKLATLYAGVAPMGEVAGKELGDELYSLGFTSFEGESASVFAAAAQRIPPPGRGALEDLFARAGLVTALVDFRDLPADGRWLRAPLVARLLGHTDMRADWTRIVDGVVFLRTMQRSRK